MDGDGDGSISVSELERALVRARTTPHLRDATVQAIVLNKLESALLRASNNGLKLVDVFAALDTSGDGLIDANELRDGLAQLAAPGGIASQVARRKREAAAKAKAAAEAKAARRALMQRRRRKEAAEASGAADVLRIINAAMVARGQRLQQIFVLLDTSGDGFLDHIEIAEGLRKLVNPGREKGATLLEVCNGWRGRRRGGWGVEWGVEDRARARVRPRARQISHRGAA